MFHYSVALIYNVSIGKQIGDMQTALAIDDNLSAIPFRVRSKARRRISSKPPDTGLRSCLPPPSCGLRRDKSALRLPPHVILRRVRGLSLDGESQRRSKPPIAYS